MLNLYEIFGLEQEEESMNTKREKIKKELFSEQKNNSAVKVIYNKKSNY